MVQSPTSRPAWRRVAAVLAGALALCWAALVNGGPFLHPDSIGYVRGPDVAVMKLAGERFATPWALFDPGAVDQRHAPGASVAAHTASYNDNEVMAGRSIYYGVLAYLGALTGGFWLTVFVQALAVAWLAEIALRALRITGLAAYGGVMALLALATPAPFFVAFLMPDIWVGAAIGAVALTFAAADRLKPLDVAMLGAVTIFAALAHNSAPLVLLGLGAAGGAVGLLRRRHAPSPWPGLAICGVALVGALAGNLAFGAMVKHTSGRPPLMPPFLSARLIADGTGTRFVRERCHGAFAVCAYGDRFPMGVDDFLWGSGRHGVFDEAPSQARRALGDEQTRFAVAVVRAYPLQQAAASARNAAAQAVTTELSDFDYNPIVSKSLSLRTPPAYARVLRQTLAYHGGWPIEGFWALQSLVLLAAAGAAVGAAVYAGRVGRVDHPDAGAALIFFVLVVVGAAANAAVCGALSTLYGRCEARVVWTLPLAAAALLMAVAPRRLWAGRGGAALARV